MSLRAKPAPRGGCRAEPAYVGRLRAERSADITRSKDRGSASLWLLAIGLLLVVAAVAGAAVGAARVARHQARVAADLGALAGAARTVEGAAVACARANEFVRANGANLTGCDVDGFVVQVTVEVRVAPLPGLSRAAPAAARAGPVGVLS